MTIYEWRSEHTRCEVSPTGHHEWEKFQDTPQRLICHYCLIPYAVYARQELVPLMGPGETWKPDPILVQLVNLRRSSGWDDTSIARQWTDDIWRIKHVALPQHLVEYLISIIPFQEETILRRKNPNSDYQDWLTRIDELLQAAVGMNHDELPSDYMWADTYEAGFSPVAAIKLLVGPLDDPNALLEAIYIEGAGLGYYQRYHKLSNEEIAGIALEALENEIEDVIEDDVIEDEDLLGEDENEDHEGRLLRKNPDAAIESYWRKWLLSCDINDFIQWEVSSERARGPQYHWRGESFCLTCNQINLPSGSYQVGKLHTMWCRRGCEKSLQPHISIRQRHPSL